MSKDIAGKKAPGKFTIKFNRMDPAHRQVIDTLEAMGRTKAQFLANAVLHYIHCDQTPDIPQALPTNDAVLEAIVRRILDERLPEQEKKDTVSKSDAAPKKVRKSEDIRFEDAAAILGEDGMAAITSTLSAFRSST